MPTSLINGEWKNYKYFLFLCSYVRNIFMQKEINKYFMRWLSTIIQTNANS